MLVGKIENGAVTSIIDARGFFGSNAVITEQMLKDNNFVRVNAYRNHDRLTQKLVPCEPVFSGDWVFTVAVAQMTAEEIQAAKDSAMANIRAQRNQMLAATDWRYRRDLTTTPDWDAYCQALRDLPATIAASGADPRTFDAWPRDPNWVEMPKP